MFKNMGIIYLYLQISKYKNMYSPPNNIDTFTITPETLVSNTNNFGINIENPIFDPTSYQKTQITNNFICQSNFEPVYTNHTYTIRTTKSASFTDRIVENWDNPASSTVGGISWYGTFPTDYWVGARLKIYRTPTGGNTLTLIHTATCTSYTCVIDSSGKKDNSNLIFNPPMDKTLFSGIQINDIIVFEKYFYEDPLPLNTKFPISKHGFVQTSANAKWIIDTSQKCPEGNSTSSLRVSTIYTPPNYVGEGIFSYYVINTNGKTFNFIKGKQYTVSVWLRQVGLIGGIITLQIGTFLKKDVTVTDKWTKFTFDLQMTNPLGTNYTDSTNIKLYVKSSGTFWVDNFQIYQKDSPQNDILPYIKTALQLYKPGCIRIWTHYKNKNMKSFICNDNSEISFGYGAGRNTAWSLAKIISTCLELGANPWLILHPIISEEEVGMLMEYLFGPPQSVYGSLRVEHGYRDPFPIKTIYFECGNETWNSIFAPLSWFSNVSDMKNYVAIVNRFTNLFTGNKYYSSTKVKTIGNGSVISPYKSLKPDGVSYWPEPGYSLTVAQNCRGVDMIDYGAYYYEEDYQTRLTLGDGPFFNKYLFHVPRRTYRYNNLTAMTKQDAGHNIDICVYEGGPNYPTPTYGALFNQDAENLGKSFASAIVTLNNFLYLQSIGHKEQNLYQFSCDVNWGSHADPVFQIPHPPTLALSMRNNYCSGDMLKVDFSNVKKIDFPAEQIPMLDPSSRKVTLKTTTAVQNIPLIDCYVYKNTSQISIILINRSMEEDRNINIVIPYTVKQQAYKHYLNSNDVRNTNLNQTMTVDVVHTNIADFSNNYSTICEKHSITIYVADLK
jgi:hypothetical protein